MSDLNLAPMDEYNRILVDNVHPPTWVNPEPQGRYNLVVIGAGSAGLVTAAGAAGLGARVALVERNLLGGDCLNVGCVPSKCVIRSSRAVADIRDAERFGVHVNSEPAVDFAAVMERMRRIRSGISRHDSAKRFKGLGVDVFIGDAQFVDSDTVEVAGKRLKFRKAVIATGARAVVPPIEGLAQAGFLTNETVFNLTELPRRLAVVGGGPIGCELAQAFGRLGSEVTIIERSAQFLTREDPDAAAILAASLERDGVQVKLNAGLRKVNVAGDGKHLMIDRDGEQEEIVVDEILIGAGRARNVDGLGLQRVAVEADARKGVTVNDRLQTTNPRIYACGDVCLSHKFTHTADATARIVLQNALFWGRKKLSALTIPWCTYTNPEIAHVGIYENEANDRGIEVDTYKVEFKEVDRAIAEGEEEGFVKIHTQKRKESILGATIVARHAGEMISEITLAMVNGVGLGKIAGVIHPYPTQAEAIRKAGDLYNKTKLTPSIKRIFERILAWQR